MVAAIAVSPMEVVDVLLLLLLLRELALPAAAGSPFLLLPAPPNMPSPTISIIKTRADCIAKGDGETVDVELVVGGNAAGDPAVAGEMGTRGVVTLFNAKPTSAFSRSN